MGADTPANFVYTLGRSTRRVPFPGDRRNCRDASIAAGSPLQVPINKELSHGTLTLAGSCEPVGILEKLSPALLVSLSSAAESPILPSRISEHILNRYQFQ